MLSDPTGLSGLKFQSGRTRQLITSKVVASFRRAMAGHKQLNCCTMNTVPDGLHLSGNLTRNLARGFHSRSCGAH